MSAFAVLPVFAQALLLALASGQDPSPDEPLLQSFGVVFLISLIFWGIGLVGQRLNNRYALDDYNIRPSGAWVRLLGIKPHTERFYLRYGLVQLMGLIYLMAGLVVWSTQDVPSYDGITTGSFILFTVGVFIFLIFDVRNRMSSKPPPDAA